MYPALCIRGMRNVDKENHVTRAYADVPLTYERDGDYVNGTAGYSRITCFSFFLYFLKECSIDQCLKISMCYSVTSKILLLSACPLCVPDH